MEEGRERQSNLLVKKICHCQVGRHMTVENTQATWGKLYQKNMSDCLLSSGSPYMEV